MRFAIKQPESPEEFIQHYDLRWRILRAPWGEPKGSEVDDIEDQRFQLMAIDNGSIVGAGRLQYNSSEEAQIRYMAITKEYEGHGIGRMIVDELEEKAASQNINTIVLDAREPAVGFYQRLGYRTEKKSYVLFKEIQHFRMIKQLSA